MRAQSEFINYTSLINSLNISTGAFEKDFPLENFESGEYKQHPSYTLLTCSDSRVPAISSVTHLTGFS